MADTAKDPNGVLHLAYGPCGATYRRFHVGYHAETGRDLGYATEFGHKPCGVFESPVSFIKAANDDYYIALYRCEDHDR